MTLPRRLALAFVFLWFLLGGIGHFIATDVFMTAVPPWWHHPREAVLVSGVFELLGAFGLIPRVTRPWAGWGLFALILLVTPANVYMLQNPKRFHQIPYAVLVARMPMQVFLIFCVIWSTRTQRRPQTSPA